MLLCQRIKRRHRHCAKPEPMPRHGFIFLQTHVPTFNAFAHCKNLTALPAV
jgi:hypothetical protein